MIKNIIDGGLFFKYKLNPLNNLYRPKGPKNSKKPLSIDLFETYKKFEIMLKIFHYKYY